MELYYPGTFDPITRGHVNIIRRGANFADSVIVGVCDNPGHKTTRLSTEIRAELVRLATEDLPNVRIHVYQGEGMENAIKLGCGGLLRGVRSGEDFEYEQKYAQDFCEMQDARDRLETVYLGTCQNHGKTSSSMVRNLIKTDGDWRYWLPLKTHDLMSEYLHCFA